MTNTDKENNKTFLMPSSFKQNTNYLIASFFLAQFFAFAAKAENSKAVTFNGTSNFTAAARNQSNSFEQNQLPDSATNNRYKSSEAVSNNSQLFIKTKASTDSQIKYGSIVKLESEASSDQNRMRFDIDQASIFAENSLGKIEFGNISAVNQKMKTGPASFARGNGGINGNYLKYVNFPVSANANSNIKSPNFILVAQSPIGHGGYAQGFDNQNISTDFNKDRLRILRSGSFNGAGDALKINYYTVRIEGVQIGASYTSSTADRGVSSTVFSNSSTTVSDVLSYGINYTDEIDNLGYAFSVTGENGRKKTSGNADARNDLSSYDLATTLTYFGFTLGASYGSWGNSLQQKSGIYSCDYNSSLSLTAQDCSNSAKKFSNASYYTLGLAYQIGPIGASITSLKSTFQQNEYSAVSLDIDYKLTRGLIPYLEITQFEFKSNQPKASDITNNQISNNKGFVALLGFIFSF